MSRQPDLSVEIYVRLMELLRASGREKEAAEAARQGLARSRAGLRALLCGSSLRDRDAEQRSMRPGVIFKTPKTFARGRCAAWREALVALDVSDNANVAA